MGHRSESTGKIIGEDIHISRKCKIKGDHSTIINSANINDCTIKLKNYHNPQCNHYPRHQH